MDFVYRYVLYLCICVFVFVYGRICDVEWNGGVQAFLSHGLFLLWYFSCQILTFSCKRDTYSILTGYQILSSFLSLHTEVEIQVKDFLSTGGNS